MTLTVKRETDMNINKALLALAMGLALSALSNKDAEANSEPADNNDTPPDATCDNDAIDTNKNAP